MKRTVFSIILILIITTPTFPCRCQGDGTIKESFDSADVVFKAKVLSVIRAFDYDSIGLKYDTTGMDNNQKHLVVPLYYVTMKIEKVFKGENIADTVKVLTPISSATCGYRHFKEDHEFTVYALNKPFFSFGPKIIPQPNHYWVHHCFRTDFWFKEDEEEIQTIINKKSI